MEAINKGSVSRHCMQCDKLLQSQWKFCPACGQNLGQTTQARIPQENQQKASISTDRLSHYSRYIELQKLCHMAVTMEQEALIGVPEEERVEFSREFAPYLPQNLEKWLQAAELGIPDGQYLLGSCLLNVGEKEEGLKWLKAVVSQGHNQAKRLLGDYLLDFGQKDEGLRLLIEASDAGDAYACERLAERYEDGDGVKKCRSKYRFYIKRAAKLGSDVAKLFLEVDNRKPFWQKW